ncbi:MAG: selenocysteine-specific translation elongation factor [Planctomycetota bacterium]
MVKPTNPLPPAALLRTIVAMNDNPQLVVGTAGHIDHGKSRLVKALTGTDPDRLPEEQARGMTIELGFAHTRIDDCDISFVDVPGHERFIRKMVAGATGIDVALLVVAADDSVMPQTREHAEVLSLLGIQQCLVVLTKMDLVDDEWAEQVEQESAELLANLGIEPIQFIRTSAQTGRGLDEVRTALAKLARAPQRQQESYRWFCMPVDRAFTIAGRGTVVTGSSSHGEVTREDTLELWPGGEQVRVRDLQTHYDQRATAAGRMRLAINLAGVPREQVDHGCTLATPGYLEPTRRIEVWIASLRMPGKQRRQTLRLRLHIATSEVLAELRLLERPDEDTVRNVFGQIHVAEPVVAAWGQRFILRDESGSRTLGGGGVLRLAARPWTARRPAFIPGLEVLRDGAPVDRLEEVIRVAEWQLLNDKQLSVRAGLSDERETTKLIQRLTGGGQVRMLEVASSRACLHSQLLTTFGDDLERRIKQFMRDNPRLPGVPRTQWPSWMPNACTPKLRPVLSEWYIQSGRVGLDHDHIIPAGQQQQMSPADQKLFEQILQEFEVAAFQPPAVSELSCYTRQNAKRVRELVQLAVKQGRLVRITSSMWLHESRWRELVKLVVSTVRERGEVAVGNLRTMMNSSRKFVVPIAERLDAVGITKRVGDVRRLGPNASAE